jgi:hypothetical protein
MRHLAHGHEQGLRQFGVAAADCPPALAPLLNKHGYAKSMP